MCTSKSSEEQLEAVMKELKRTIEQTGQPPSAAVIHEIEQRYGVSLNVKSPAGDPQAAEGIAQLEAPKEEGTLLSPTGEASSVGRIEPTMMIAFTCTVCGLRQGKSMSKGAYEEGVVLITCDGCKSRHLIADNLGWFGDDNSNVESILAEKGLDVRKLSDEGQFQLTKEDLADLELSVAHADKRREIREAKKAEREAED